MLNYDDQGLDDGEFVMDDALLVDVLASAIQAREVNDAILNPNRIIDMNRCIKLLMMSFEEDDISVTSSIQEVTKYSGCIKAKKIGAIRPIRMDYFAKALSLADVVTVMPTVDGSVVMELTFCNIASPLV